MPIDRLLTSSPIPTPCFSAIGLISRGLLSSTTKLGTSKLKLLRASASTELLEPCEPLFRDSKGLLICIWKPPSKTGEKMRSLKVLMARAPVTTANVNRNSPWRRLTVRISPARPLVVLSWLPARGESKDWGSNPPVRAKAEPGAIVKVEPCPASTPEAREPDAESVRASVGGIPGF